MARVRAAWQPKPGTVTRTVTRAVGYIRVSTIDQVLEGYGLQAQRQSLVDHAQSNGWDLVAMHADEGISGTVPVSGREGLRLALDAVLTGAADALMVRDLSRLGRHPVICWDVFNALDAIGASFVSILEPHLGSQTLRGLFIGIAADERTRMLERLRAGRLAKVRAGGVVGRPTYGYRVVDAGTARSRLEVVPDEASIVRRIFGERARGATLRDIAGGLNRDGVPSPSGIGRWHIGRLSLMLDSVAYRGDLRWREAGREWVTRGAIPAILDDLPA